MGAIENQFASAKRIINNAEQAHRDYLDGDDRELLTAAQYTASAAHVLRQLHETLYAESQARGITDA